MTPDQALAAILVRARPTRKVVCPLPASCGRSVAEMIRAPDHLPRFDNAAMDGFAVRARDLGRATEKIPVRLKILGEAAAGVSFRKRVRPGTAIRISTGAMLPAGADAVVMQEDCRIGRGEVDVLSSAISGENIRRRGEEIRRGEIALRSGTVLNSGSVAWLASMGVRRICTRETPRVGILRSGEEVVEWKTSPRHDQVRDTHGLFLRLQLERLGIRPLMAPIVRDDAVKTRLGFASMLRSSDVVITTGGISVGPHDEFMDVAKRSGMRILFSKVDQKPGKPFTVGVKKHQLWFGLPGNPFSAVLCYLVYVRPALLRMMGWEDASSGWSEVELDRPVSAPRAKTVFLLGCRQHGRVRLNRQKGSHCLGAFARSNVIVRLDPTERARMIRKAPCLPLDGILV